MEAVPPRPSEFTVDAAGRRTRAKLPAYGLTSSQATLCLDEVPEEVVLRPRRAIKLPDGRKVVLRLTRVRTEELSGSCRPAARR
jgi:hypothetical protein